MDPCSVPTATDRLSPGEVLDPELAPLSSDSSDPESLASSRPRARFNPGWLKTFPFLRFSPTQNLMWCHVCRFYAESLHQNHSLIRGTDRFRKFTLTAHSSTRYHLRNVQRYQARHSPGSGSGV